MAKVDFGIRWGSDIDNEWEYIVDGRKLEENGEILFYLELYLRDLIKRLIPLQKMLDEIRGKLNV